MITPIACLVILVLQQCHSAAANLEDRHLHVRDTIVAAINNFPSAPPKLLALLDDDANWCDPYPACQQGKENISTFLHRMPPGTDTILLPEALVTVGSVGGLMTKVSFSWPGASDSCLYSASQHVSWNISSGDSSDVRLSYVRWVYNASEFDAAISACLGDDSAAGEGKKAAAVSKIDGGRAADLQAVMDYVVGLQFNQTAQALICDLLVDTARYCDPYPETCAFGRNGCRAMKGLPPTDDGRGSLVPPQQTVQTRASSVRPLMASGPTTGAMYIAYSSAKRTTTTVGGGLGRLSHKLHHTFAIWDLAPADAADPSESPAPMLASFDWFMPEENI